MFGIREQELYLTETETNNTSRSGLKEKEECFLMIALLQKNSEFIFFFTLDGTLRSGQVVNILCLLYDLFHEHIDMIFNYYFLIK